MSFHWLIADSDALSFHIKPLSQASSPVLAQISFGSDVRCDQNFVIPELREVGAASAARVPHLDGKCSRDKNRG
jgi:hypothetical protein